MVLMCASAMFDLARSLETWGNRRTARPGSWRRRPRGL